MDRRYEDDRISSRASQPMGRRAFLMTGAMTIGAALFTSFSGDWALGAARQRYMLAPESLLPADTRKAPAEVREAYRFAIANRDVLRYIPCYCGCIDDGHTSNASCYLKDSSTPGNLVFDRMSLNWKICIDITRDVMRMLDQGRPLKEIRMHVDSTYSRYGPPTPTPPVP